MTICRSHIVVRFSRRVVRVFVIVYIADVYWVCF